MIRQNEIRQQSELWGVPPETVDKDWVLSHVLKGIFSVEEWKSELIFKGGTCLRKCHFPNYRFSEDLDFTARTTNFNFSTELLEELCLKIEESSDIKLSISKVKEQRYQNRLVGYEIKIKYWGANHKKNDAPPPSSQWHTYIKLDTNWYEMICSEVENKPLFHPYSDNELFNNVKIPVYSIPEILGEKLRSLIQRKYSAARDYYDIWTIIKTKNDIDWDQVVNIFLKKCQVKSIVYTDISQMINPSVEKSLDSQWNQSLGHQLFNTTLPNRKLVTDDLFHLLSRILPKQ